MCVFARLRVCLGGMWAYAWHYKTPSDNKDKLEKREEWVPLINYESQFHEDAYGPWDDPSYSPFKNAHTHVHTRTHTRIQRFVRDNTRLIN